MRRIQLFSKLSTKELASVMKKHKLQIVKENADVIVTWGGDGTFLLAEERYPGIPKLLLRKDSICELCTELSPSAAAAYLAREKNLPICELIKLTGTINKKIAIPPATNDIVLRNATQMHALRFTVKINGKRIGKEHIGDGVVVATPWGSSGYYRSITRTVFDNGIGVAFNNTVQEQPAYLSDEKAVITITITRGEALLSVDTSSTVLHLKQGDEITVRRAQEVARVVDL